MAEGGGLLPCKSDFAERSCALARGCRAAGPPTVPLKEIGAKTRFRTRLLARGQLKVKRQCHVVRRSFHSCAQRMVVAARGSAC